MIKDAITYQNAKLENLGFFNTVLCLCEKIDNGEQKYPAQYSSSGEYQRINLDPNGSLCYWRKDGDVTIGEEENSGGIGIQYRTSIPLRFIGYLPKESGKDDQYFSDNVISGIIGNLTVNNSALKSALKAKIVRISATKYSTNPREVWAQEYEDVEFNLPFTHAYFSIDFKFEFVTSSQCYTDICGDLPINFGYVTIKDQDGNVLELVKCGGEYICSNVSGGTINIYIDGELNQSIVSADLDAETVNISM